MISHFYKTFNVFIEYSINLNYYIKFYGNILWCTMEDDNLD